MSSVLSLKKERKFLMSSGGVCRNDFIIVLAVASFWNFIPLLNAVDLVACILSKNVFFTDSQVLFFSFIDFVLSF